MEGRITAIEADLGGCADLMRGIVSYFLVMGWGKLRMMICDLSRTASFWFRVDDFWNLPSTSFAV
jgi:hypothetical protein